jgi:hypothetical protein
MSQEMKMRERRWVVGVVFKVREETTRQRELQKVRFDCQESVMTQPLSCLAASSLYLYYPFLCLSRQSACIQISNGSDRRGVIVWVDLGCRYGVVSPLLDRKRGKEIR